jgi:hypothetical protein
MIAAFFCTTTRHILTGTTTTTCRPCSNVHHCKTIVGPSFKIRPFSFGARRRRWLYDDDDNSNRNKAIVSSKKKTDDGCQHDSIATVYGSNSPMSQFELGHNKWNDSRRCLCAKRRRKKIASLCGSSSSQIKSVVKIHQTEYSSC